jgi:hypothetical protein
VVLGMATKKIIRVLVYEGEEENVRRTLQLREVKGSRVGSNETITETFVDHADVRQWLGEQVSGADMASAVDALVFRPLDAPSPLLEVTSIVDTAAWPLIDGAALNPLKGPRDVPCQFCGAKVGERCTWVAGPEVPEDHYHSHRVQAMNKANNPGPTQA